MHTNSWIQTIRLLPFYGILGILIWKAFFEDTYSDYYESYDPQYEYELHADVGTQPNYPELDAKLLTQRKILLTSDINSNSTKQVVGSLLYLNTIDPLSPIDLYVSTEGGYYDDAFAIVDCIQNLQASVNTYAVGGSHSSGTIIVAAGTGIRSAYPNALMMVHDNLSESGFERFNLDDHENKRLQTFWQQYPKIPESWFTLAGDETYFLDAGQALEFGLIDQILEPTSKRSD